MEKGPRRECIREGFSSDYGGYHYKVYSVRDIPGDLLIEEALKEIRQSFLPKVSPYQFRRVDYSRRYVQKAMKIDMFKEDIH